MYKYIYTYVFICLGLDKNSKVKLQNKKKINYEEKRK